MYSILFLAALNAGSLVFDTSKAPKIETHGRVIDLFNGEHFDDLLKDTPDAMRPPTLLAFLDSTNPKCMRRFQALSLTRLAETVFPPSERLMIAKYDMGVARLRSWTQWTYEKDLRSRFGVGDRCPAVAIIPRKCNGWTKWCRFTNGSFGCPDFVEQCSDWEFWDPTRGESLEAWVAQQVAKEGNPKVARILGSYQEQGRWLRSRWAATVNNHQRNAYLFPSIPQYTEKGYNMHPIPDQLYSELLGFYERHKHRKYTEEWDTYGQTQINFHEVQTRMVSLDFEPEFRDRLANTVIKPILEKWSGKRLQFSSFYGIREYPEGSFLHNHLDRIDTHVISATMSLLKLNVTDPSKEWPIVAISPNTGAYVEYVHHPGTWLYYESSKVIHGRPSKNPVGGGVHLGCFVHFAVVGDDYDALKERAKRTLEEHETILPYRGTASVEPVNPGEDHWCDLAGQLNTFNKAKQAHTDGKFSVSFVNDMAFTVQVFWVGPQGFVFQCSLAPSNKQEFDVYPSHRFLWILGDDAPAMDESSTLTAVEGRVIYRSSDVRSGLEAQIKARPSAVKAEL